ncbi:chloride channel protein 2 isoform X1 [Bombus vosnesenskii]|uniref:Chloride channel protein 2 isoform X1 n=6 Tax=Pyrobombus TaxID=144703 RepID=A0A6J3LM94_9HYME|nr:chloride channel protein 2 isoform X1 [Bombus impatiens]XP_033187445.1 chloride channel protein 2 isoform X1 [Bombus vancouverensis nearcticus]XP_033298478.1 chloride channel protein 2 isoform X1 [Bombus bifarius]XP_033366315.1 chloride channel protein 2 isoform X1 [Bombus vosnesenskii]XP_050489012.1 chloride channel protein 2 isoform X2 [Bombus huntii]
MANQATKKELREETLHYHPDGSEEEVDKEWEEFTRLMAKLRENRRNRPHRPSQAFYPCPPPNADEEQQDFDPFDYINTIMYGRYTKDLGEYAKEEARKLKYHDKARRKYDKTRAEDLRKSRRGPLCRKLLALLAFAWKHTGARLGEDWVFLALLGIIMALISYAMDRGISMCNNARIWLYQDLTHHPALQYLAWVSLPVCLILFSAGFVHIVAPQSIGSGIPEMKTILRGVALKEYLTFRTLVAKVIGLTATLGSGLPLGKEGPFVHIASIVATLLSKLVTSFQGIYENESRNCEMLAAACAVGVAACFAAPIGGVLFSIEVTTVYFAVRNYWRGFFAAVCGATMFRLLAIWFQREETITAMFATNFTMDFPFDPQELFVFALIGVGSGLGGAFYVWLHRQYVIFMRKNKSMNSFLQKNRFLYPGIVSLIVSSVSFPLGLGQFMAGDLNTHDQVYGLFTNFTWTKQELGVEEMNMVKHWSTIYTDVFIGLISFVAFTFIFSIISSTVPVPSGIFIPVFKIGAALGRAVGEAMALWFPNGVRYGGIITPIVPGGYATVGAAAFSGAVTHTISVSVIVFEMTGQITHIVPIMIAVLISNAIAALLQPSIYDSIILIKKLPYLPDLLPSSSGMYNVYVEDFMVRDVKNIWHGITYQKLKEILKENRKLRGFPLVDNPDSMILLGSIQRLELIKLIEKHIGRERRLQVAQKWHKEAEERAREEMERQLRDQERTRRPSRFEVIPAPDILKMQRQSVNDLTMSPNNAAAPDHHTYHSPVFGSQPKKSILKKTNSFTLKGFSPLVSPAVTPYTTVTGAESRIRLAFEAIFRKSATLQDVDPDPEIGSGGAIRRDSQDVPPHTPMLAPSPATSKKVQLPRERVIDMSAEDQKRWEESEMMLEVDFSRCHIDPAPFQLVERTSLLKVHSLFSMVGVNHAYVTAIGRLVGVVGLKELRKAIEDANAGILPMHSESHIGVSTSSIAKSETDTESKNVSTMNSIVSVDCEKVEKV